MRMDEHINQEWKQMLRGTTSGRRALEVIAALEAENRRLREENNILSLRLEACRKGTYTGGA